jgi:hypothetical protein
MQLPIWRALAQLRRKLDALRATGPWHTGNERTQMHRAMSTSTTLLPPFSAVRSHTSMTLYSHFGIATPRTQTCPNNMTSPEVRELFINQMCDGEDMAEQRVFQKETIRDALIQEGKMSLVWEKDADKTLNTENDYMNHYQQYYKLKALAKAAGPGPEAKQLEQKANEELEMSEKARVMAVDLAQLAAREAANAMEGKPVVDATIREYKSDRNWTKTKQ